MQYHIIHNGIHFELDDKNNWFDENRNLDLSRVDVTYDLEKRVRYRKEIFIESNL